MADNTCANPFLLEWIKEWLDQARERNSKGASVYKKAYISMKACPLTFNHPSEAQQLNGLGPKLCDRLTAKLNDYCKENGLPMPEAPNQAKKRPSTEALKKPDEQPTKRPKTTKPYVPKLRSGPYALILGLATIDEDSTIGMTKARLVEAAQPYCDSSFTAPTDPTKFYTAWNSMKTLLQKGFVYEHGRPLRKYLLTDEGWEIAKGIQKTAENRAAETSSNIPLNQGKNNVGNAQPNLPQTQMRNGRSAQPSIPSSTTYEDCDFYPVDDILAAPREPSFSNPSSHNGSNKIPRATPSIARGENIDGPSTASLPRSTSIFTLPPSSFTIELVLDVREVRTPKDREYISNELYRRGIDPIVRSLELGDALWVAKCKDPNFLARYGEEGDEVMLDWILERKRLDDLVSSIKDGRFHEQKFRLRRSGLENVIYLIEEFSMGDANSGAAMQNQEAVASAMASTQVVNGYFVKKTANLDDSIRYLAQMTNLLRKMYTAPNEPTSGSRISLTTPISVIPTSSIKSAQTHLQHLTKLRAEDKSKNNTNRASASNSIPTTYTTTFATFSALSSKSDTLTLRDVYLKMLMCTRGISSEKALEIQRRWRTPREFVEAYESEKNAPRNGKVTAQEDLVSSKMSGLIGNKKIGIALSKKIAEVWGVSS